MALHYGKLYAPSCGTFFHIWNAVKEAETADCKMLAVKTHPNEPTFPLLSYLHRQKGVSRASLDGTEEAPNQHAHAHIQPPSRTGVDRTPFTISCDASSRGEFAHLHAEDVRKELQNGTSRFVHDDVAFRLYTFTFQQPSGQESRLFIFCWHDAPFAGQALVASVYRWASRLDRELWVYNGVLGGWRKDRKFYEAVCAAETAELILPDGVMEQLNRDTTSFFQGSTLYQQLGVAWKRGILLLGPPGNGKTGMIKVLAKECVQQNIPVLYVQSAKTRMGAEAGINAIFQKARREAPCLLIIEDIETFITSETRTFLLNQLDGIESNDGILVIATANDASTLDPAILHRPSRFDAKYHFELPDAMLRRRYILRRLGNLGPVRLAFTAEDAKDSHGSAGKSLVDELVVGTESWSFAFLKEYFISLLLSCAVSGRDNKTLSRGDLLFHLSVLQRQTSFAQ